jgi:hypothetical protein
MAPKTPKKRTPKKAPAADDGSGPAADEDDPTPTNPPKIKHQARDPSAGYLASTPEVPKLDPKGFGVWKVNFVTHVHRTLQHMRFLELKSIIEETPVGQGHPSVPPVVATDADGAVTTSLGDPRMMVIEYGRQIVEALRTNDEVKLPPSEPDKAAYAAAVEDQQIAMDVLYALLQQACKGTPEAQVIVNSHRVDGNGPWQAWKTLVLKYEPHGTDRIWRALDAHYAGPTSTDPADRDAQLAVTEMQLVTACGNDPTIQAEAAKLYTLYYVPAVERGNADLAQRVRERMTTDRSPVTVANWRTVWYAITAGDNVVQPTNVQANFVRQQPGVSRTAAASAARATGPPARMCLNCKGAHRVVVCPHPCNKCGCDKRAPLPDGTSLQGHYSDCVVVSANDAMAKLVTVARGPDTARAARDRPPGRGQNQSSRAKQRDQVHAHVVQYVELLGKTEDPAAKTVLLDYIAEGKHELERLRIADDVEAANMVAASTQPSVLPFSVDQSGYDSGYDRAGSDPHKPSVSEPSASGPTPVHSTGPSIFLSRPRQSVRTVPALLTAAALALMASFGKTSRRTRCPSQ